MGPYDVILDLVTSDERIAYIVIDCGPYDVMSQLAQITLGEGTTEESDRGTASSRGREDEGGGWGREGSRGGMLYLVPSCDVVHRAAADVARRYRWNDTALLYDSVHGQCTTVHKKTNKSSKCLMLFMATCRCPYC